MDFGNLVSNLLGQMAFFHLSAGNYIMIGVALVFLYLAIAKGFEPLLLIPIAFGMLLVNIYPDIMYSPEQTSNGVGGLLYYFFTLDEWSILPALIFMCRCNDRLRSADRKPNQLFNGCCSSVRYLLCIFLRNLIRILRKGSSLYLHHRWCRRPYFPVPLQ